jgi:hypothetical protein
MKKKVKELTEKWLKEGLPFVSNPAPSIITAEDLLSSSLSREVNGIRLGSRPLPD